MVAMNDSAGTINECRETKASKSPEPRRSSFCAVPTERTVYAGPSTREEFDRIPLPETIHEWKHDEVETLIRNDGRQYERLCHSKSCGDIGGLYVIFQWFDSRVAELPKASEDGAA